MLDLIFDEQYHSLKNQYKNNFNQIQKDLEAVKTFIDNIY